tara:strand:+ start:110 stop:1111 length:1002 start_codon:yes stop_codon:yes gene_type:complete
MAYTTIDDPTLYFSTTIYTGDGQQNRAVTIDGTGMQPDWLWVKSRSETEGHVVGDSVRGATIRLIPNSNDGEATRATNIASFTSDGFTVANGGVDAAVNKNSQTYVSWAWKESATAGFDICSWTGNGSAQNISHNLSKVPTMIIVKNRTDDGADWYVYNVHNGNTHSMILNTTSAKVGAYSDNWNNTTPTSSVFTVGSSNSTGGSSSDNMIAYVFTDIQGFSKFGTYTGNGNADGTFVYTGFKPAWVMVKKTNNTGGWQLRDNKRTTFNLLTNLNYANATSAEQTTDGIDFLSNGWKLRNSAGDNNASGDTYIFMAFAENPFVSSTGVPATTR